MSTHTGVQSNAGGQLFDSWRNVIGRPNRTLGISIGIGRLLHCSGYIFLQETAHFVMINYKTNSVLFSYFSSYRSNSTDTSQTEYGQAQVVTPLSCMLVTHPLFVCVFKFKRSRFQITKPPPQL